MNEKGIREVLAGALDEVDSRRRRLVRAGITAAVLPGAVGGGLVAPACAVYSACGPEWTVNVQTCGAYQDAELTMAGQCTNLREYLVDDECRRYSASIDDVVGGVCGFEATLPDGTSQAEQVEIVETDCGISPSPTIVRFE